MLKFAYLDNLVYFCKKIWQKNGIYTTFRETNYWPT